MPLKLLLPETMLTGLPGLVLEDRRKLIARLQAVALEGQVVDRGSGVVLAHVEVRQAIVLLGLVAVR